MNLILRTDHIIERLSKSKRVPLITFVLAFLEQSFSPILPEAYLALILSYRKDISWKFLSFVSACGSSLGALTTYTLGYFLYKSYGVHLVTFFGWEEMFTQAQELFSNNVFMAQLVAAITPLPDRVFSFAAGAFGASLLLFFIATFFGRLLRSCIVAYLAYEWGDEARVFIKKHTRSTAIVISVLVVIYIIYRNIH